MIISIFPWLANDALWASGIGIRSLSAGPETICIIWSGSGRIPDRPVYATIPPYGEWGASVPAGIKNAAALVIGSDATMTMASTRIGTGTFSFVPPISKPITLGDVLRFFSPVQMAEWSTGPYATWISDRPSNFTVTSRYVALLLAGMKVFYEFPDRQDRALGVLDACVAKGQTPGHPTGSHTSPPCQDVDLCYYVMKGVNNTQYPPSPSIIWDGDKLTGNFDRERTTRFLEIAYSYLPDMTVQTDDRIASAIGSPRYMHGDRVPQYNHNKHMHVDTGDFVNYGALI